MFLYSCPLRWSDLDAQGHVNNAVVLDYLQEARVAFLLGGDAAPLRDSGIVVVAHQVEYHRPIAYSDEPVTIELVVAGLGAARIEIAYRVLQDGELAAVARTVLCPFDFTLQRPVRLTALHRDFFASHLTHVQALSAVDRTQHPDKGTAVELRVRWSDIDSYGHVNNAVMFDYIQQARVQATTSWDPTMARAGSPGSDRLWLVVRQDVDYLAQLPYRVEPYEARVAPVKLGNSSLTLATDFIDGTSGLVFTRAWTVLVSADRTGRPVDLGDETRARLSAMMR